jgi:hypothetical protein
MDSIDVLDGLRFSEPFADEKRIRWGCSARWVEAKSNRPRRGALLPIGRLAVREPDTIDGEL